MKTYSIYVKDNHIDKLLKELSLWGVSKLSYKVDGDTIITKNLNVVDVAIETFLYCRNLLEIREVK